MTDRRIKTIRAPLFVSLAIGVFCFLISVLALRALGFVIGILPRYIGTQHELALFVGGMARERLLVRFRFMALFPFPIEVCSH